MKFKTLQGWKIPSLFTMKQGTQWLRAKQVYSKVSGRWVRTADYHNVMAFEARCISTDAAINAFAYETIWKGDLLIESGDTLEYELYSNTGEGRAGLDFLFPTEKLRHFDVKDQNGIAIHPAQFISEQTLRWHRRVFSLNVVAGMRTSSAACCIETDQPGLRRIYIRNAFIRRADGTIKLSLTNDGLNWPAHEAWVGAGYSLYEFVWKGYIGPLNLE